VIFAPAGGWLTLGVAVLGALAWPWPGSPSPGRYHSGRKGGPLARASLLQTDPSQIGRYRLVARLGAGGMGVVYLGEYQGHQVAVKVLRPELADDPEFRTRFGREVSALTRVQGMCTVRVIEADTEAPKPFLVTEYADGPSLSEYASAHGPLDPGMLYGLATGLAEALTAIHAAGIVHRDLKPSNVLLTAGGPKVIDFGIAQALDTTSLTRTGITVGSAGYMAPEQVTGRAGTAADIFTWAVTVAFAASGQPPFGTGASDVILYRIVHGAPDLTAVPPGLRPLVEAALAKEPQARPTAPQLLSQLTHTAARYDNPTQTVLAQTWHAPAAGPIAPALGPTGPGRADPGLPAGRRRHRGRLRTGRAACPHPRCGRRQHHADPARPGHPGHQQHHRAHFPGREHDDPGQHAREHPRQHRGAAPGPGGRQLLGHETDRDRLQR
jgi:tRNA A-37 threonylcarbamoyl transferase component Bud32